MALQAGTRIGPYEVIGQIGAGGMGEVYRATDINLTRQVAIKVLPDTFANDPERLARFEREAKTLASLNHPNIAQIYGLEKPSGIRALVMELVEGETLADRIARGPIPIDEVLPIAKQIAEALEAAHEQGIIHRDLKPANIKLRPDGTVKVLDFGLAKALEPTGTRIDATASPTITSPAMMTGIGVLLGTAAYMSPEQARGKPVDKRSDIWAFGCVVFEMLTGERAFDGDEVSDTLAAILRAEPDWAMLPPGTPATVRRLLRRCLDKNPRERLHDIGDARYELKETIAGGTGAVGDSGVRAAPAQQLPVSRWQHAVPWVLAAGSLAVAIAVVVLWAPWRRTLPPAPVRLEATLGADASLDTLGASLAASPDGSLLSFVARSSEGTQQLYMRRLREVGAVPVAGTINARDPFFSPDSEWIAFFADGSLKKVAVTGGAAVTLCPAGSDRGGWWAEDGSIVFQPAASGEGLSRVSSAGGTPVPLTKLGAGEVTHRWPQVLPGGRAVTYTAHSSIAGFDDATIVVQPLPDGTPKIVQRGGYYGRYLPSGHFVYVHQGTLFVMPFDIARLEPTGQPVPVIDGISTYAGLAGVGGQAGAVQIAWSGTGTVIYFAGQETANESPIEWMDRAGRVTPLRAARAIWSDPQFSPDGRRLALNIFFGQSGIFTYDWVRDALTRVTFGTALNSKPVWTPDGRRLVFRSSRDAGVINLYWQRTDGSGDVERLTDSPNPQFPGSWHPGGRFLAFYESRPQTGNDLMILPMEGDEVSGWKPGQPTVFLDTPFAEQEPVFSPDGRFIAYQSTESGRAEVYVRPFSGPGGRWLISTDGGTYPVWSRTRQELFFSSPDNRLMVASYVIEGGVFQVDKPRIWSERRFMTRPGRAFDLHPDGERFALDAAESEAAVKQDRLIFVFNFFEELKRLVPN